MSTATRAAEVRKKAARAAELVEIEISGIIDAIASAVLGARRFRND